MNPIEPPTVSCGAAELLRRGGPIRVPLRECCVAALIGVHTATSGCAALAAVPGKAGTPITALAAVPGKAGTPIPALAAVPGMAGTPAPAAVRR